MINSNQSILQLNSACRRRMRRNRLRRSGVCNSSLSESEPNAKFAVGMTMNFVRDFSKLLVLFLLPQVQDRGVLSPGWTMSTTAALPLHDGDQLRTIRPPCRTAWPRADSEILELPIALPAAAE